MPLDFAALTTLASTSDSRRIRRSSSADLDLGAAVLREDDLVALGDVHRDELALVVARARADREDVAALRLLLRGVRQDDAARWSSPPLRGPRRSGGHPAAADPSKPPVVLDFVTIDGTLTSSSARRILSAYVRAAQANSRCCFRTVTSCNVGVAVKREFSAGGVLVRVQDGRTMLAAIRPAGKPEGLWALPKGRIGQGEQPEATAVREVEEETGVRGEFVRKLGDVRYVYTWEGERIFKVVSFYPPPLPGREARRPGRGVRARGGRRAVAPARRGAADCSPTRESATWPDRRSQRCGDDTYDAAAFRRAAMQAMYALNFYSPIVADQLRTHRKTATIRLGDKSAKYRKGMIVQVLCGARYSPREKVFDAVIDKVEVKTLGELSPQRDPARQPRAQAPRRDGQLPRPALQPRRVPLGHGHDHPLQRDQVARETAGLPVGSLP